MSLNLISGLDCISLAATLVALALCLLGWRRTGKGNHLDIFPFLLIALASYEGLLLVEWLGISRDFDTIENYVGALLPLWWLFALYSLAQVAMMREVVQTKQRLEHAMEATTDGLWDWDVRSGKTFFSPHWFEMLGYANGEQPSTYETWKGLLHPDDQERAHEAVLNHLDRDDPFELEVRMLAKSGDWMWVLSRGKVVERGGNGAALRVVGTHVDISDRMKRQARIRELQLYLSNVINSMPSVLVGVAPDGAITQWNSRAESETGFSSADILGRSLGEVFPRLAVHMDLVKKAIASGETQVAAHQVCPSDQGYCFEDVMVYPLISKELEGAVIRADNVTERTRMQEVLMQSEKMLALGGVAAGMAHEINNPLTVIVGYAHQIKRRVFSEVKKSKQAAEDCGVSLESVRDFLRQLDIHTMLDRIIHSGELTSTLVRNMLNFSKKSASESIPVNIADLVNSTLAIMSNDYEVKQIKSKDLSIVRLYKPDVPLVICEADKIQQVLFNIIRNAVEAMKDKEYDKESPRIIIRVSKESEYVVLEVEDNGPGMDPETREMIFNAFFTTKGSEEGTGLGLSISYFIVTELHHGIIEVQSTPGEMTRFIIKLPIAGIKAAA